MNFVADTRFLELFLFLHSIELITSQPDRVEHTTSEELYPQSSGIHFPPIEKVSNKSAELYPNFKVCNGWKLCRPAEAYYRRGSFIFGSKHFGDIKLLGHLFEQPHLYAVFNTENQKWYTLSFGELQKLGVSRRLKLVRAHDEAHALVHEPHHEVNSEVHNAASKEAYLKTRNHEGTVRKLVVTTEEDVRSVKEFYQQEYSRAFRSHSGEASGGR